MPFELTEEQKRWRDLAREFAEKYARPRAEEIDRTGKAPYDLLRKVAQPPYRFTGVAISKADGGLGLGIQMMCIINEELAAVCPPLALFMEHAHMSPMILGMAGDKWKKKFLPGILAGEEPGAFCLTEPDTGSDPASMKSAAELVGNEWVISGRKRFSSHAGEGMYAIVMARTKVGISAFMVEKGNPGLKVIDRIPTIGLGGHTDDELLLDNCRVPKENLIGEEGRGLRVALGALNEARTSLAAGYLGLARAAFEAAVKHAKERRTFGRALAEHQAIRFPLAEVATDIDAARFLIYRAAALIDAGQKHRKETAMAKQFAAQTVIKATDLAMKVYGGYGCTRREPVERFLRDARTWIYAQGSPEMMKEIIARDVLA